MKRDARKACDASAGGSARTVDIHTIRFDFTGDGFVDGVAGAVCVDDVGESMPWGVALFWRSDALPDNQPEEVFDAGDVVDMNNVIRDGDLVAFETSDPFDSIRQTFRWLGSQWEIVDDAHSEMPSVQPPIEEPQAPANVHFSIVLNQGAKPSTYGSGVSGIKGESGPVAAYDSTGRLIATGTWQYLGRCGTGICNSYTAEFNGPRQPDGLYQFLVVTGTDLVPITDGNPADDTVEATIDYR